jgi:hypothetical protein
MFKEQLVAIQIYRWQVQELRLALDHFKCTVEIIPTRSTFDAAPSAGDPW